MGVRVPLGTPLKFKILQKKINKNGHKKQNVINALHWRKILKEKIKQITNTKQFHMCMVLVIIVAILFVAGVISLKYNVEGEGTPPFTISKVSVISSVDGTDVEGSEEKWNLKVNQNNDIYLYIKKNEDYKYTETIADIKLENFNIVQSPKVGQIKLLKPDADAENVIFRNSTENETQSIIYEGDIESNMKLMKVSNQGGLVVFRYAISELGNYTSNEDEQINHNELLKKLSINNDDLKFKVSFDISINLDSNKSYKANMSLELPVGNVVDDGIQSQENTDFKNLVFKRM